MAESEGVPTFKIIPFSEELQQVGAGAAAKPEPAATNLDEARSRILKRIEARLNEHDKALGEEVMVALRELLSYPGEGVKEGDDGEEEEEERLRARCEELENSLELLRLEYEKTEDYWSEKLEEERTYFEEEQKVSDKKYSELLDKILEYEEMLDNEKSQRQRLETIEEKDSFEKQVADMEQECAELRAQLAETIRAKETEIERLKQEMAGFSRDRTDSGVQVQDASNAELSTTENESDALNPNLKPGGRKSSKHVHCRQCSEAKNVQETRLRYQKELDMMREERERLFKEIAEGKQVLNGCCGLNSGGGGHAAHVQNIQLEQRCASLMTTLRQQQKQTEDILKSTWRQHKAEVADLKSVLKMTEDKLKRQTKVIQEQLHKLGKTDLLVKDLFVENAYLVSSVRKLEERCQASGQGTGQA